MNRRTEKHQMSQHVFINLSNHPSEKWDRTQTEAAEAYGLIIDMPFPAVDPKATSEEIRNLGREYAEKIMEYDPAAVMCQGEFTLCYTIIKELKERGVTVLAACARRMVDEVDGARIARFIFEGFREY